MRCPSSTLLLAILLCFTNYHIVAQNYELVWADEFNGSSVDPTKWSFQLGDGTEVGLPPGWGNNELQFYRTENAVVANGLLTITAKQETFNGYNYTSSRLRSLGKGDFKYGRIEMRAKLPTGQGIWPAFWMLSSNPEIYGGWAASGEIDIMEYVGQNPSRVFGTIHYGAPWPGNVFSSTDYTLPSGTFHDDFHVFAVEWEYGEIRWYVDDTLYATKNDWFSTGGPYPAPFDLNFHLLINLAVGGNLPGSPDETTVFPQEYIIDYVRLLQKNNEPPSITLTTPHDGDTIAEGANVLISANVSDDGAIYKVEFFQGDAKLGEDLTAPYELIVQNVSTGCYTILAKATDDGGLEIASAQAAITVGTGCSQSPYLMTPGNVPGTIEAEHFDAGGHTISYYDEDRTNISEEFRTEDWVDIERTSDSDFGYHITNIKSGEWLEYTVDITETGFYDIEIRVAGQTGGAFRIDVNEIDKTGTISFPATDGPQQWTFARANHILLEAGVQTLRLVMLRDGFYVNKINIKKSLVTNPGKEVVFDDMEHGAPLSNGWFFFGGTVGGGGINFNTTVPPEQGGTFSLETGWGSGGTPGYFGGFGRTFPADISGTSFFTCWINTDSLDGAGRRQHYTLELNLQEDDNGDNMIAQADDDEFQYNLTVGPPESGAEIIAGTGWQRITAPLNSFFDDNSYLFGGNGTLDPVSVDRQGNGQLINVVIAVISHTGADVTFRTDYWAFSSPPEEPSEVVFDNFEDGNTSDWSFFGGNQAGGGGGPFSDRPLEGSYYMSTGWGGQGSSSVFYGGFFKNLDNTQQLTLPELPWINMWVLNQQNATTDSYTLEITIREDTDGNGYTPGGDDSFRLDTRYTKFNFDDRWTLLSAPLSDFMDLSTGGDGVFNGKLDETVIVISGVEGQPGSTVEVDFDQIIFTSGGPLLKDTIPPVFISCTANVGPVALEKNACDAIVTWNAPHATDTLSTFTLTQIEGPPSGSTFSAGTVTEIVYEAKDVWGNTSFCSFTVTIAPGTFRVDVGGNRTIYSGYKPAGYTLLFANASGGVPPYTYDWGKGNLPYGFLLASPKMTTTYYVKAADSNGCIAEDSVTVCVADIKCGRNKVLICDKGRQLCIPSHAVFGHLLHGDKLGVCGVNYECPFQEPEEQVVDHSDTSPEPEVFIYPIPFNDKITFRINVTQPSHVVLQLYDKLGQPVAEIINKKFTSSTEYVADWPADRLQNGIYYYTFQTNGAIHRGKIVKN